MIHNYFKKEKGFTLVEVLVAVSVFSFAVLSLMVILGDSLSNINYVKKKIVATYLAQEGIEYMRNLRDTFVLYEADGATPGWTQFLDYTSDCFSSSNSKLCYFDPESIDFSNNDKPITEMFIGVCAGNNCPHLYFDADTLTYNYSLLGADSGFSRAIHMERVGPDELSVESFVFWGQNSGVHQVSFKENIFNWTK